ncbi:MAG: glycosyltransferase family 39 protein [Paludisphaera borealis]|uniref:ArnT family glycosyltransferase n=1 Tax=Paludisphaera borealis TaxID=1387353 RepID=UPI00283DDEA3|nr:glycosyltransferase family 39 protein [Paludisphaera borealis]MDR3619438.1 glycosyltransferase family 39 protein [Paludisphaera borealis]
MIVQIPRRASPGARTWLAGLLIATAATLCVAVQTNPSAPPRYDGAGYAVLATALLNGQGYRAIDHPDKPRHAHFPPGYPAFLALVWSATGRSDFAAHVASGLCTVAATLAAWLWFRTMYARPVALAMATALACNWVWSRSGAGVQSEPLFELLGQLAILAAVAPVARGETRRGLVVGSLLGAAVLTRHVGLALAAAVFVDMAVRRQWRTLAASAVVLIAIATPWVVWQLGLTGTGGGQIGLLVQGGRSVFGGLVDQAVFYGDRIPDQLTGPFVEVATTPGRPPTLRVVARCLAWPATALVVAGWIAALAVPRRRLAGLVPLATLALLLIWPYTEAGRFLIPLVPCLIVGAVEGLSLVLKRVRDWSNRRIRVVAACLVLGGSLPYTAYAMATADRRLRGEADRGFDAACGWIQSQADRPGPILTRHPGEVFLRTGRQALEATTSERPGAVDADPQAIAETIARYGVAYLLVDDLRYAAAVASPLDRFVKERPETVRQVMSARDRNGSVRVFEVLR